MRGFSNLASNLANSRAAFLSMKSVFLLSGAVFLSYLLLLPTFYETMFGDPDTFWHIALGDEIRRLGKLPEYDAWSLFAGQKHLYITSWGWDTIASYFYEHYSWHGLIVMNSITIAAVLAVVFASGLIRCGDPISAYLSTFLAFSTMLDDHVRPHQAGLLFSA